MPGLAEPFTTMDIATYVLSLLILAWTLSGTLGEMKNMMVTAGGEITLTTGLTGLQGDCEVLWYLVQSKKTLVYYDHGQTDPDQTLKRSEGNLDLDTKTGCLTVKNVTESGIYQGEITEENNKKTIVTYNVIVLKAGGSSHNTAVVLKGPLAFVVAAVCIPLLI